MAAPEEQLKRNAELKLWMENRIAELQEEMDRLKEAMAVIDTVLRASSFRPAAEVASSPPREEGGPIPEIRELKRDKGGEIIAVAEVTRQRVKIEPVPDVALKADTPPFRSFFLGKILTGMKTTDEDSVAKGRIRKGEALSYTLSESGGRIAALVVENYREKERLNEILNTAAWTFSRMLEK